MITEDTIKKELSNQIDMSVVDGLLRAYRELKKVQATSKHDQIGQKAGLFFEEALKACINVKFSSVPSKTGISFEKEYNKLMQETKTTLEDETVCLLIPTILKSGYTLRNKKRISHARGIDPAEMDSQYLCKLADWVIAEFLRTFHSADDEEIESYIKTLMQQDIPLVETINEEAVILDSSLSAANAILLLLYQNNQGLSNEDLIEQLEKYYSKANISTSRKNLEKARLVHTDKSKVVWLTTKGIPKAQEILNSRVEMF